MLRHAVVTLAVYVHFPWCLQRCPYCDFATSAIKPAELPHTRYADAVCAEIARRRLQFAVDGECTVFFGGGTPSLWDVPQLARVLSAIRAAFGAPREVTVECNPSSLSVERAAALREAGVTRLSIGVQSLRDHHLRYLGRLHDADGARRAVAAAVSAGGLRVSADLMFGMPEQRVDELVGDAEEVLDSGARHLSIYSLTIEPGTRFGELARKGRLPRLPDDDVAALYEAVERAALARGLSHYEVSNYAAPGEQGLHNVLYWRGADYVGLGAAAVGCHRDDGRGGRAVRYRNDADVAGYLAACERGATPPEAREELDGETLVREGLMLGLRTEAGVDLRALGARAGRDPRAGRERAIARQVARGNMVDRGDALVVPRGRWLLADEIVSAVF
jgi:oxygen-independent coproporphyrinogen-3 oxidase